MTDAKPRGPRRALRHQRGQAAVRGEPEIAAWLGQALDAPNDAADDVWTHGFHVYPARMHWAVARGVIAGAAAALGLTARLDRVDAREEPRAIGEGDAAGAEAPAGPRPAPRPRVLDPFCGSGTVLVEARAAGWGAVGVDLNPLAVRLATLKASPRDGKDLERLREAVERVADRSRGWVRERAEILAPLPASERQWYAPHVLKELAGLWTAIGQEPEPAVRRALELVFSAMVVKFSLQRGDTSPEREAKTIGRFIPTEFFERKGDELVERLGALGAHVRPGTPRVKVIEGDVRRLPNVLAGAHLVPPGFELIVSSPPYGGTYDYLDHHARRMAWLGLDDRALRSGELGARRHWSAPAGERRGGGAGDDERGAGQRAPDPLDAWDAELHAALDPIAEVLAPTGVMVLLLGDAQVGGARVPADEQLERLAPQLGLRVRAVASHERPDFTGGAPRAEHLIALGHDGTRERPSRAQPRSSGGRRRPPTGRGGTSGAPRTSPGGRSRTPGPRGRR